LCKEREFKRMLSTSSTTLEVTRARGSFGTFDIQCYTPTSCNLYSVKSTRSKYWSSGVEIKKLKETTVPPYCRKYLAIYWSPRRDRIKRGWEVIPVA